MFINKLPYCFASILLFFVALQFSAWGVTDGVYDFLRYIIIGLVGILFILSIKGSSSSIFSDSVILVHSFSALIFCFLIILVWFLGYDVDLNPLRDFLLGLLVLITGYNLNFNDKILDRLCFLLVIFITVSAVSILYVFSAGFFIHEQYLPIPKNQFSPLYSIAFVLSLYFFFKNDQSFKKIILLFCAVVLFMVLLVIRGRSSLLATLIVSFIFIAFYLKGKKNKIFIFITILMLIPIIVPLLYDSFFLNYDISSAQSISAGRTDSYIVGIMFIKDNFLLGTLGDNLNLSGNIHNYIVFNLVNYGFIIAFPIVFTYFFYIFNVFKSIKNNKYTIIDFAPLLILILYIISFFEYTYPYAPGSTVLFPFLFFGIYLRRDSAKF